MSAVSAVASVASVAEDVHAEEGNADQYKNPVCQEPLHDGRLGNCVVARDWSDFAAIENPEVPGNPQRSRSHPVSVYFLSPGFGAAAGALDLPIS